MKLELDLRFLRDEAARLVRNLNLGSISESAYDTAWVARIPRPDQVPEPLFPACYDWLLNHQNPDGSWGAAIPFAHDRLMCTLASILTLSLSTYREEESARAARRAIVYLNRGLPDLAADPVETVGFELLLPSMCEEAKQLGIRLPYESWKFVDSIREAKMRRIPPLAIYGGPSPLTHSLEFLGDRVAEALAPRSRLPNGSYGASPSATAYMHMRVPQEETLGYLQRVTSLSPTGGVPYVYPFELFETSWVLHFLRELLGTRSELDEALGRLERGWTQLGAAWTAESPVPDADDTAVMLLTLSRHKRQAVPEVLELFEVPEYFQTFTFERDPSVTTNAHVLLALRQFPSTEARRRMVLKVIRYLEDSQDDAGHWHDKWHASPFYAIHEATSALAGLSPQPVRRAVRSILECQQENGAWGFDEGTVEETAWAMSTLLEVYQKDVAFAPQLKEAVSRGLSFLNANWGEKEDPSLWIGKSLYKPNNIVRSIVVSTAARAVEAGLINEPGD